MRALCLLLGLVTLGGVWITPLGDWLGGAFSAHMLVHMGVVAVAAPLISLGVAGRRLDPVRMAPALFLPVPASLVELVVVWAWHTPALHHAARHSSTGFFFEQGSFLLTALWVWHSSFGGAPHPERRRTGAGVLALLLTSMHMTLLGALIALSPRPLFGHSAAGRTALEDQHLGGAIMLLVGGVSYLAGGLSLVGRLLRPVRLGVVRSEEARP
jgi:putative membrane protein